MILLIYQIDKIWSEILGNQAAINAIKDVTLVNKYPDLFSNKLDECTKVKVELCLKQSARLIHAPRRPVLLVLEEQVSVDRLVQNGILTPGYASEWVAPIVVAKKANRKIRICADYFTRLNEAL